MQTTWTLGIVAVVAVLLWAIILTTMILSVESEKQKRAQQMYPEKHNKVGASAATQGRQVT